MARQRKRKGDPISGWLNLFKPVEMTSTQAVAILKRLYNADKVGHGGTLDPLADGILPIAFGEATKTVQWAMDSEKEYVFTIEWGTSTDSQDTEGAVTATSAARPSREAVEATLSNYIGLIQQVPPRFSAIKVDGQRAYDLAREGEDFELKSREVVVHSAKVIGMPDADHTVVHVTSGKGFYVRAMARDLAFDLGCEGHISQLRRTRVGSFSAADAVAISALQEMTDKADLLAALKPLQSVLTGVPALDIAPGEAADLRQGRSIMLMPHVIEAWREARNPADDDDRLALASCNGTAVALGDVRAGHFEPVRVFNIRASQSA
ncbi:tRNA pseudouridine(55) synthase TruB [Hyphomonas johnsonii]|uniref:tRNA pseudouridine synthase B n=1 Tax=Hyphomonas johnsonii MHS-2 TaxID=1280950 RepID=A0A059FHP4_9PROT|nr:tRNA pseudouridine(55) synthase TruB [Hyphomonas johnsonii]KCZ90127.1 tRNA pseudouridine synthase B [Hyphomonas johnsonii MHS-2]